MQKLDIGIFILVLVGAEPDSRRTVWLKGICAFQNKKEEGHGLSKVV